MLLFENPNPKLSKKHKELFDKLGNDLIKLIELAMSSKDLLNENERLNNLIQIYKSRIFNLEKTIERLEEEKDKLKIELKINVGSLRNLRDDEDELKKSKIELSKLKKEIEELKKERQTIIDNTEQVKSKNEKEISGKNSILIDITSQIALMKGQYDNDKKSMTDEINRLESLIRDKLEEFHKLSDSYDELRNKMKEEEKKVFLINQDLINENALLKSQLSKLRDRNQTLTDNNNLLTDQNKRLSDENQKLSDINKELQETIDWFGRTIEDIHNIV
jgi:chromosome segregation ATPase